MTEAALAGMATPPDVIVAANDDMALGAIEALKARNLTGSRRSSASTRCPRRWPQVRDGGLTATIEQFPGGQSARRASTSLVDFLRDGKKPAEQVDAADADRHHQGQPRTRPSASAR